MDDKMAGLAQSPSTPTLDFLLGHSLDADNLVTEVRILLLAVKALTVKHHDVVYRVRHGGLRIYYDVFSNAPHGISARLTAVAHRNIVAKHANKPFIFKADEFEWLLRPLVYLSQQSEVASDLHAVVLGGTGWGFDKFATAENQYGSLLQYIKSKLRPEDRKLWKAWRNCFPLQPQKRDQAVAALMALVRRHAWSKARFWSNSQQDLNLELLEDTLREGTAPFLAKESEARMRRIYRWGLENDKSGFSWRLSECFEIDGLASEEYEDLLEQMLWALSRASEGLILPGGQQR